MAYTSLVGANLTNADMTDANILGADLTDAVLCNATLTGVNPKDTKGLPEAGLPDVQHRPDPQDNTNETPPSLLPASDWL
ncbi:hypothetical protein S616_23295 [Salmonella enterica subsp. enterica]|nr:hypothetical protein [Salmonella enterica subsp. enterica]